MFVFSARKNICNIQAVSLEVRDSPAGKPPPATMSAFCYFVVGWIYYSTGLALNFSLAFQAHFTDSTAPNRRQTMSETLTARRSHLCGLAFASQGRLRSGQPEQMCDQRRCERPKPALPGGQGR